MKHLPLGFKKNELIIVSAILISLVGVILINLQVSYRKSRDAQRKGDLRSIYDALHAFQGDYSFFPLSDEQGRILACLDDPANPAFDELGNVIYDPCEYGEDDIQDVIDPEHKNYLSNIPRDPQIDKGYKYIYISNGKRFQIYAALEGASEAEYSEEIRSRDLSCGTEICNFGHASGATPLDKSLEQYENELLESNKN